MNDWDDDTVGDELRKLFGDDRLDVRPAPGADRAIVSGARRRRRRRAAAGAGAGTLAVLGLIGGGLALSGVGQGGAPRDANVAAAPTSPEATGTVSMPSSPTGAGSEAPPSSSPAWTTSLSERQDPPPTSSPATSVPEDVESGRVLAAAPVLGPDGYLSLRLGMSYRDATATGLLDPGSGPPAQEGCASYRLAEGAATISEITISGGDGIVRFRAADAQTPEGIRSGSSLDQLRSAYSDLSGESNGYVASASESARYVFTVAQDTVSQVQLESRDADC